MGILQEINSAFFAVTGVTVSPTCSSISTADTTTAGITQCYTLAVTVIIL